VRPTYVIPALVAVLAAVSAQQRVSLAPIEGGERQVAAERTYR
jgi:hypothetical protein